MPQTQAHGEETQSAQAIEQAEELTVPESSSSPGDQQSTSLSKNPVLQKQLLEAALYVSGRPLDLKILGTVIGARSEEKIRGIATRVLEQYREMDSPLQVLELPDGRWVMQLKAEFARHVKRLSNRPLLTPGPLRTLSYIALRQPVPQSHVVKVRGKLAYGHVKQLREMDLITDERIAKTRMLRTTTTFADYFNLSHDVSTMQKELKNILPPDMRESPLVMGSPGKTVKQRAASGSPERVNPATTAR